MRSLFLPPSLEVGAVLPEPSAGYGSVNRLVSLVIPKNNKIIKRTAEREYLSNLPDPRLKSGTVPGLDSHLPEAGEEFLLQELLAEHHLTLGGWVEWGWDWRGRVGWASWAYFCSVLE